MLEDKAGKLTLQQVIQSLVADQFHFNQSKDNQFDYTINAYWFCYRLRNTMNHDAEIGFGYEDIQNGGNERSAFYLKQDGKWNQFENGLVAPRRKLNGLVLNNYIPVFNVSKKIPEQNYVQDENLYIGAVHDSILIMLLKVSFQSIEASFANPVTSLRSE